MKPTTPLFAAMFALSISACSSSEPETAEPPSNLDVNSAKRQCSTTASMAMMGQGVPEEAIKKVCDCSIDKLVDTGDFTAEAKPDDASMEGAMNTCLEELEAEMLGDAETPVEEAEAS
ncbi:MAG: hypothetical protein AAF732_19445 [Pseudomonadota bacterium]